MKLDEILKLPSQIASFKPSKDEMLQLATQITKMLTKSGSNLCKRIDPSNALVLISGDTHGNLEGTIEILREFSEASKMNSNVFVIFLGDYIDRGPNQIQNLWLIMSAKVEFPEQIILMRGNHDNRITNQADFLEVCQQAYPDPDGKALIAFLDNSILNRQDSSRMKGNAVWATINDMFDELPLLTAVGKSILCIHGGIPVEPPFDGSSFEDFLSFLDGRSEQKVRDMIQNSPDDPVAFYQEHIEDWWIMQMLWNDPLLNPSWGEGINENGDTPSIRGPGLFLFSQKTFEQFMDRIGFEILCRAHEPVSEGFRRLYKNRLWTIFSILAYGAAYAAKYVRVRFDEKGKIVNYEPVSIRPLKEWSKLEQTSQIHLESAEVVKKNPRKKSSKSTRTKRTQKQTTTKKKGKISD